MTVLPNPDCGSKAVPKKVAAVLRKLYRQLIADADVSSVVLFGSYSKGTYGKNSDVDVAVFVHSDDDAKLLETFRYAQRCASLYPLDIQILVFRDEALAEPVGIVDEIVKYGKDISGI